jgi:hypothetical protein
MVYVLVVVFDAAILAPAVVGSLGDFAVLGDLFAPADLLALCEVLTDGELVLAECGLALTACEHENPVRPSARRTAMIPAIPRITR